MADDSFPDRDPDFWYEASKDQLAQQLSDVDAIDSKLAGFVSTGSALIGILAAVLALVPQRVGFLQIVGIVGCSLAYAVLAAVTFASLAPRRWGVGLNVRDEWKERDNYTNTQFKWRAASRLITDLEANESRYSLKASSLRVAIACLILETVFTVAGLGTLLLPGGHA